MKEFETDAFRIKLSDNFLKEIRVKKNVTLSPDNVRESMALSANFMPGEKFYVLIEGEENGSVSTEARRLAASEEYSRYTAALALCSNSLYLAIIGNLFLTVNRPKVPTRFFERREDGLIWLEEQMKKKH